MRPEALEALAGVDLIIHAGDVGSPEVLRALSQVAPVEAIRGNVDTGPWARTLPDTREVHVGEVNFYVIHDANDLAIDASVFDAVVSGHSHRAKEEKHNGVLYLNPGSAGPQRFRLPVTLMTAIVQGKEIRVSLRSLTGVRL
jgi:hypothetical protein